MVFIPFTKLADEPQVSITIVEDGIERTVLGFTYRCDGITAHGMPCRLVWDRAWLAKECVAHGHKSSWTTQQYGKDGAVYQRTALRRWGSDTPVAPAAPVAVAAQATAVSLPIDPEAQLRALAAAMGFRVSRIPKAKAPASKPSEPAGLEDIDELFTGSPF
jgi:hypothetical protein